MEKKTKKNNQTEKKTFIDLFKITEYSPKHWFSVNRNANLPKTLQRGIKSKWVDRFIKWHDWFEFHLFRTLLDLIW